MRTGKQNNSMKMLLKKLRHHDTAVIAFGVGVAAVLCGGAIYVSTPVIAAGAQDSKEVNVYENSKSQGEISDDVTLQQKDTEKQLDSIVKYLDTLEKTVVDNQTKLQEIQTNTVNNNKELKETILKEGKEKETNNTEITKCNENIEKLNKDIGSISDNIGATKTQIEELKTLISDKSGTSNMDKVATDIAQINNALNKISGDYTKFETSVTSTITELKTSESTNNTEVVSSLKDILNSVKSINNDDISTMISGLNKQGDQYIKSLNDMEKNISTLDKDVDKVKNSTKETNTKVDNVANSVSGVSDKLNGVSDKTDAVSNQINGVSDKTDAVSNQINGVSEQINTGNQNIIQEINKSNSDYENEIKRIDDNMQKVFQSVDNARGALVGALSSQGITFKEEPTLSEIAQMIKVLSFDKVKGNANANICEYEAHYHKDANGNIVNGERCDTKGGCFTVAVPHVHTEDCYEPTHTEYRYLSTDVEENYGNRGQGRYYCSYCDKYLKEKMHQETARDAETAYKRVTSGAGFNNVSMHTVYRRLICTKTDEYYVPSCGHHNGDVLWVKMKFDHNNRNPESIVPSTRNINIDTNIFNADQLASSELEEQLKKEIADMEGVDLETEDDTNNTDNTDNVQEDDVVSNEETADIPKTDNNVEQDQSTESVSTQDIPEEEIQDDSASNEASEATSEVSDSSTGLSEETNESINNEKIDDVNNKNSIKDDSANNASSSDTMG